MITAEFEFTCTLMFILFFYSHLMGMFYRSIRMLENGIKPVYVFDGKPPDMKSGEVIQNKPSTCTPQTNQITCFIVI